MTMTMTMTETKTANDRVFLRKTCLNVELLFSYVIWTHQSPDADFAQFFQ